MAAKRRSGDGRDLDHGRRRRQRERWSKSIISRYSNNFIFMISPSRSDWKVFINIAGIKLASTVWLFGKKITNISSGFQVLYTTLKISQFTSIVRTRMAKKCTKMQNAGTGRAEPLLLFIKFVVLWRFRSRRRRPIVKSLFSRPAATSTTRHTRGFETRTATGRENFACQDSGVSQILVLIISNGEKILSNVNVVA